MISFCIDAKVAGTLKHVLVENDKWSFVNEVPENTWHLTGKQKDDSNWCLDTLLALERFSYSIEPDELYVNSYRKFVPDKKWPPPWSLCMPKGAHESYLKGLIDKVRGYLIQADTRFYKDTWVKESVLFASLVRATVREDVYDRLIKANADNVPLKSFAPNNKELAKKIVYNRTSTRTGRLTVTSGPQILTLRRDLRPVMCPSGPDRTIFSYDFRACEMHVLLYEAGHETSIGDLYENLGKKYLPGVERSVVKGAVIKRAYGQTASVWGPELGLNHAEADRIDRILAGIFRTELLLERLQAELKKHGFIRNRYGRKVIPSSDKAHILINSYAQSSGADVGYLGFASMLAGFERLDVKPIGIVHDCLYVDVPDKHISKLRSLNSLKIPGYDQRYSVLFEELLKETKEDEDERLGD